MKVKTNAKKEEVNLKEGFYEVKVNAAPVEGKANESVIKLISEYFKVSKSRIRIIKGETSRNKLLEINKNWIGGIDE